MADVAKTWVQMYLDSDVTDWEKQQLIKRYQLSNLETPALEGMA